MYNYTVEGVPFSILLQVILHCGYHRDFYRNPHRLFRELGTIELQVKNEKNADSVPVTYRQYVISAIIVLV